MQAPKGVFLDRLGYMNFTHAIRVSVVSRGEDDMLTLLAQAFLRATSTSIGKGIHTILHIDEVQEGICTLWSPSHPTYHTHDIHLFRKYRNQFN
jgi:hypothetical protein